MNTSYDRTCPKCRRQIPAGYTFCPNCAGSKTAPVMGWEIALHSAAAQNVAEIARVTSDVLGISVDKVRWRLQQPERLLAVGLDQAVVWRLKTELRKIGVTAFEKYAPIRPDPFPGEPSDSPIPRTQTTVTPRISRTHQVIIPYAPVVETRTIVGLSFGRANSYLAFTRAQGDRLLALPSMVSWDGQTVIPTVVMRGAGGAQIGRAAAKFAVLAPEDVTSGFANTPDLAQHRDAAAIFLTALRERLAEVTATGQQKLHISLGDPLTQDAANTKTVVDWVNQAGMQVDQVVPEPLAVVASFLQQGKLPPLNAGQVQHMLVFDGGECSNRIACVERLDNGEMRVIDNQVLPDGGQVFDQLVVDWMKTRLPVQDDPQTLREMVVLAREFKVQMSRAFAMGRPEYTHFCILNNLATPMHITIRRDEFEKLAAGALKPIATAFEEAPARVGLQPENIAHVLLAGGGAGWYFIPQMVQAALRQAPLKDNRPEETTARGLAVYGLIH